jgi:hypothetical protein
MAKYACDINRIDAREPGAGRCSPRCCSTRTSEPSSVRSNAHGSSPAFSMAAEISCLCDSRSNRVGWRAVTDYPCASAIPLSRSSSIRDFLRIDGQVCLRYQSDRRTRAGSRAMFTAMRRASSTVRCCAPALLSSVPMHVGHGLPIRIDTPAPSGANDRPRGPKSARHSENIEHRRAANVGVRRRLFGDARRSALR